MESIPCFPFSCTWNIRKQSLVHKISWPESLILCSSSVINVKNHARNSLVKEYRHKLNNYRICYFCTYIILSTVCFFCIPDWYLSSIRMKLDIFYRVKLNTSATEIYLEQVIMVIKKKWKKKKKTKLRILHIIMVKILILEHEWVYKWRKKSKLNI